MTTPKNAFSVKIKVTASGNISDDIKFPKALFEFSHSGGEWRVGGELAAEIFKHSLSLKSAVSKSSPNGTTTPDSTTKVEFAADLGVVVKKEDFSDIEGLTAASVIKLLEANACITKGEKGVWLLKENLDVRKLKLDGVEEINSKQKIRTILLDLQSLNQLHVPDTDKLTANPHLSSFTFQKFSIELAIVNKQLSSINVSGTSSLVVWDPTQNGKALFQIDSGTLALSKTKEQVALSFTAEEAKWMPLAIFKELPFAMRNGFSLGIKRVTLQSEQSAHSKSSLELVAESQLKIEQDVLAETSASSLITAVFPEEKKAGRVISRLSISGSKGVSLAVMNEAIGLEHDLSAIIKKTASEMLNELKKINKNDKTYKNILDSLKTLNEKLPETGSSYFCLREIFIGIAKEPSLKATVQVGLPANLNELIFGSLGDPMKNLNGVIQTYVASPNPTTRDASVMQATLELNGETLSGSVSNFPPINFVKAKEIAKESELAKRLENGFSFKTGSGKDETKKVTEITPGDTIESVIIDFDGLMANEKEPLYGKVKLLVPKFSLSTTSGAFSIGGGYKIDGDQLNIPLPFESLLKLLDLQKFADYFPSRIPVRSIDFVKDEALNFSELESYLTALLPKKWHGAVPALIAILQGAGKHLPVDRLPYKLRDHLKISIPQGVNFDLEVSADKSVSFAVEVASPGYKVLSSHITTLQSQVVGIPAEVVSKIEPLQSAEIEPYKNKPALRRAVRKRLTADEWGKHGRTISQVLSKGDFSDAIKGIMPVNLSPPMLAGVRIRKFTFGSALFNSAFRIDFSGEIDLFNLAELVPAAFLPLPDEIQSETLRLILPDRKQLQRSILLDELIMFVFYQSGVPVPVPVYAKEVDIRSTNLFGDEQQMRLVTHNNLGLSSLFKKLSALKPFFTKTDGWLTVNPYPLGAGSEDPEFGFTVGPSYVRLPGILGYEYDDNEEENKRPIVIGSTEQKDIDLIQAVNLGANAVKGLILNKPMVLEQTSEGAVKPVPKLALPPVNALVQYLPLEDRYAIKRFKLLHLFKMHVAWAFSTPDEFADTVYPEMLKAYSDAKDEGNGQPLNLPVPKQTSSANYLIDLLLKEDDMQPPEGEDQGVVTFLRGGLSIAEQIIFEGMTGTLLSKQKGFRTAAMLRGLVFDVLETESIFFLKVNPNSQEEPFHLLGSTFLRVFGRDVLKGYIEANLKELKFMGMLDVFPPDFPVQINGFINGHISAEAFKLYSLAGLKLGTFRTGLTVDIDINKSTQKFELDARFASAYLRLRLKQNRNAQEATIQASLQANSFNLLALDGDVTITRQPHRLAFVGKTSLATPQVQLLKLAMDYTGEVDASAGFLGVKATLSPDSYILSKDCRPTGGAAFYVWFTGPQAGDFALSVGGYHPHFKRPDYYPTVPRLAITWNIDNDTLIRGEAYFALTPAAIMAGGMLDFQYHRGNVRVWFLANAHFLCQWYPLQYQANISVIVGASYTVKALWWSKTIGVSLHAKMALWGPPTGGSVDIDLAVVSVRIAFGSPNKIPAPLDSWSKFCDKFFPQSKGEDGLLSIVPDSGVSRVNGGSWVVRADEFTFTLSTPIPVGNIDIRPMNKRRIKSALSIEVTHKAKIITTNKSAVETNVPAALWGEPINDTRSVLDGKKALIEHVKTGEKVSFPDLPDSAGLVLSEEDISGDTCFDFTHIAFQPMTTQKPDRSDFIDKVDSNSDLRKASFDKIKLLGLGYAKRYDLQNDDLKLGMRSLKSEWHDTPQIVTSK